MKTFAKNTSNNTKKVAGKIKKAVECISDKAIQNIYNQPKAELEKLNQYLNFKMDELENYFDNVTINTQRINIY
jgi:hypothetical protein